jgi:ADP-heptose:LPS heptosyltransferase
MRLWIEIAAFGILVGMINLSHASAFQLQQEGKPQEALALLNSVIQSDPDNALLRSYRGTLMLSLGDIKGGFAEYEWRWKTEQYISTKPRTAMWDGTPMPDQTILLYTEQGFGDTFQFVRYAALAKERCARVFLHCEKSLAPLMRLCPLVDSVITKDDPMPIRGGFSTLMSLPHAFGTTLDTIPANVPYLRADDKLLQQWRLFLKKYDGFKVGINWKGSGSTASRDIPKSQFKPLSKIQKVHLIELQKKEGSEFDNNGAFMDTAAVMMNLDLIITSDTSVAHLAGALGRPTWLCLPFAPEWRWMLDRDDSPWYPTMRLFRQKTPDDWGEVFKRITSELQRLI